jgi:hypothetical protein
MKGVGKMKVQAKKDMEKKDEVEKKKRELSLEELEEIITDKHMFYLKKG